MFKNNNSSKKTKSMSARTLLRFNQKTEPLKVIMASRQSLRIMALPYPPPQVQPRPFILRRCEVRKNKRGEVAVCKRAELVWPAELDCSSVPKSEAKELIESMTPGTLYMLNEGGGSRRFLQALHAVGAIRVSQP